MIVKFNGIAHHCARAERHKDEIHLFDENDNLRYVLQNISNVEVEDGAITVLEEQEPTESERLVALEAAMLELMGVTENG